MEGRQPAFGVLGEDGRVSTSRRELGSVLAGLAAVLAVLAVATGCSGNPSTPPSDSPTASPTSAADPTAPAVPPRPKNLACRQLSFDDALAPTDSARIVKCSKPHTGQTYAVGQLRTTWAGHLVAVDSQRVQQQVARTCPRKLAEFLGTTDDELRLTMLRAVWFTPSVDESDAGANWFRCDVVAVAGSTELATIRGSLEDRLGTEEGRTTFGMCGTAAPDDPSFTRVLCREPHSWRAIDVVEIDGKRYPGEAKARDAGQEPCEEAGNRVAEDPLDYQWGYEWPTKEQWNAGQTYGRCWAPQ